MKNLLATLLITACLSTVALGGEIPGNGPVPPPPCTENCPGINAEVRPLMPPSAWDTASNPEEFSIDEFLTGILSLVF